MIYKNYLYHIYINISSISQSQSMNHDILHCCSQQKHGADFPWKAFATFFNFVNVVQNKYCEHFLQYGACKKRANTMPVLFSFANFFVCFRSANHPIETESILFCGRAQQTEKIITILHIITYHYYYWRCRWWKMSTKLSNIKVYIFLNSESKYRFSFSFKLAHMDYWNDANGMDPYVSAAMSTFT